VATRGEFDSLDVILREYARRGRIALDVVEPRADGRFEAEDLLAAIGPGVGLVVVSQVMFQTGQVLARLPAIVARAHEVGARVLLDVYHSLGVFPVDVAALDVDFAVGGSYKYLRGGTGACFLYLLPRHLDGALQTLDIGWFAKESPFGYQRPDPSRFAAGGHPDAALGSTCPSPCVADLAGDFGKPQSPWRYLEDHRHRTWTAMTPTADGLVGADAANAITSCAHRDAAACAVLPGALLISSAGATSAADPAVELSA
jgi:hypothetical protein